MQFYLISLLSTALLATSVSAQCGIEPPSPQHPVYARLRYTKGTCNIQPIAFAPKVRYEFGRPDNTLSEFTILGNTPSPRTCYFWNGGFVRDPVTGETVCGGNDWRCRSGSAVPGEDVTITFPSTGGLQARCVACFPDAICADRGKN